MARHKGMLAGRRRVAGCECVAGWQYVCVWGGEVEMGGGVRTGGDADEGPGWKCSHTPLAHIHCVGVGVGAVVVLGRWGSTCGDDDEGGQGAYCDEDRAVVDAQDDDGDLGAVAKLCHLKERREVSEVGGGERERGARGRERERETGRVCV